MRIDFNILWVEDQPQNVTAQLTRMERLIKVEGFRLKVEFAKNSEEANKFISEDIFLDHIDLVLMDYDLGDGPQGDSVLKDIRKKMPYKDVIFYSATKTSQLEDVLSSSKLQGIFLSNREDLPAKVFGIFEGLVKKVIDIEHSRGIVMSATSEIDYSINEILKQIYSNSNIEVKKKILDLAHEYVNQSEVRSLESFKVAKKAESLPDVLEQHAVFTSMHRFLLLKKLMKSQQLKQEVESKALMLRYETDGIPKRNDLAHVRVVTDGFMRRIFDKKEVEYTSESMKTLRLLMVDQQNLLDDLSRLLSAPSERL